MKIADFKKGDLVLYIPNHAGGDVCHDNCQRGVVSSTNDAWVFVKYDNMACIMKTGNEPYIAQATSPDNLTKLN